MAIDPKAALQFCKDFLGSKLSPPVRRLLLLTVIVMLAGMGVWLLIRTLADFSRPMGAPLPQFERQPSTPVKEALAPSIEDPHGERALTPEAAPASPVCGGPTEMIVLLVGSDARTDIDHQGLADMIRVARFDFVAETISMLSVPRVLWVSSPALEGYAGRLAGYFGDALDTSGEPIVETGAHTTLNTAYFYGNLYQLPPAHGPGVLAEALYINLGIPSDHYVVIDMQVVKASVDAIGGVDIDVPYDVADFSAGIQHMSGSDVLSYARTRSSDNDWYRTERQDIVLRALWSKMAEPGHLSQVPTLADRFLDDVLTDLSKAQVLSLSCLMARLGPEDIETYRISREMADVTSTTHGFFILLPRPEEVDGVVAELLGGAD